MPSMKHRVWVYGLACFLLCTCNGGLPRGTAKATFSFASRSGMPFNCYGVLVNGPGIPSLDSRDGRVEDRKAETTYCTYPGASSRFVAAEASAESVSIELQIPRGYEERLIQVVGLELEGKACPENITVASLLLDARGKAASKFAKTYGGLYEVGRATATISGPVTLPAIESDYSGNNLMTCDGTTEYPDFVLNPTSLTIHPGGKYRFTASGSLMPAGGYTFAVPSIASGVIASGSTTNGNYLAPSSAGTYKALAKDAFANVRSAVVTVPSIPGSRAFWYRGDTFYSYGDGYAILGTNTWPNAEVTIPVLTPGTPGIVFNQTTGPNGHPALTFAGSAAFSGPITQGNFTQVTAFVVAKATADGGLFCSAVGSCNATPGSLSLVRGPSGLYAEARNTVTDTTAFATDPGTAFLATVSWTPATSLELTIDAPGSAPQIVSAVSPTAATFTPTIMELGTAGSSVFSGDIAEVLIYDRALSAVEKKEATDYLKAKYNLN